MPPPATAQALLELVRRSELISADRLDAFLEKAALPDDTRQAAATFVKAGLLTRYQAQKLLMGKCRGFHLGPYRVLEPVGKGGMGMVYLGEHTGLCRRVAIKVLAQDKTEDAGALERFYREGQAAAALDHPNIVRVYDIAREGDVHFLVMEYVEGQTLEWLVRSSGPLAIERAVGYAMQAAAALQHAAEHGVVHRDIKPANLLVDAQDTVNVLDMGLARFFDGRGDDLTARMDDGAVLGTADFIAPEQALSSRVDIRADIYSLGATLYTLLAGRPPFGDKTATQKLLAHQLKTPQPLHEVRPGVSRELAAVVEKMMAKKPEDRYQTPAEASAALAPWAPGVTAPVPVPTPAPCPPAPESPKPLAILLANLPRWPAALAASLLTMFTAAGGGLWLVAANRVSRDVAAPAVAEAPKPAVATPTSALSPLAAPPVAVLAGPVVTPAAPPTPAEPPVLYRLELPDGPQMSWRKERGDGLRQPLGVPAGWRTNVRALDSTSEFVMGKVEGHLALGLRNLTGKTAGAWWLGLEKMSSGRRYHLHLSYLTRGQARCNVRLKPADTMASLVESLPPTDGVWRSARVYFELGDASPYRLQFHTPTLGAENSLFFRDVRLTDAGSLSDEYVLARQDWSMASPFRWVVNRRKVVERTGELPEGWVALTRDDSTQGVAELERVDGRAVLALHNQQGQPTTMVFWHTPWLTEGRRYRLVLEYRTQGSPRGVVRVRQGQQRLAAPGQLGETAGRWQTESMEFVAASGFRCCVEVQTRGAALADRLQLGRAELIEVPTTRP